MSRVELQKKWWLGAKPKTVKGAELEKALYALDQAGDDKRAAALAALPAAINKARAELDKKTQKDLLKDLDTLEELAGAEAKKLQLAAAAKAKADAKAAAAAEEAEPGEDKLFDPELHRSTIKRALRQDLVFAFTVGSRPESRVLALAPRGNPATFGRLARAEGGGAKVCFGHLRAAERESGTLLLTLEGAAVAGTVKALRAYFKEHKITLFRKIAVVVDGKEDEAEAWDEEPAAKAPEAMAGDGDGDAQEAAAAAMPQELEMRKQEPEQESEPEPAQASEQEPQDVQEPAAATAEAPTIEVLADRRREFKKARADWVATKARAEADLEKVKEGAKKAYLADRKQLPHIEAGCKAIDTILDNLDDALRDTLDKYAATPLREQAKLKSLADTAIEILAGYQDYVKDHALLRAIDKKEFADVQVHAPVVKALADLRKALV